jgi:acyl-CoA dehydrogenase
LFDMASPGVSTTPITLISGKSPFCSTFFHDVKVPKDNLVGERNKGWEIAKYLLTHERESIGAFGVTQIGRSLGELAAETVGHDNGMLADPLLRAKIAEFEVDGWCFLLSMQRAADMLEWEGARSHDGKAAREWLRSKANSIEGGTSEIQLNIIAKRLLGLPGG